LAASRKIQLREVLEIIAQLETEGARDSREAVAQMEKEIEKVLSRFMKEKGLTELIEFYR
jgi:urease gamma subunit